MIVKPLLPKRKNAHVGFSAPSNFDIFGGNWVYKDGEIKKLDLR